MIIDSANAGNTESDTGSVHKIFGATNRASHGKEDPDEYPLAHVGRYHPHIRQVVLYRLLVAFSPPSFAHSKEYLATLGCLFITKLCPTVLVTLFDFAVYCDLDHPELRSCFTAAERTLITSWKVRWPNVTLRFVKESFSDLLGERSKAYWPYHPDQLSWLSDRLDSLSRLILSGISY